MVDPAELEPFGVFHLRGFLSPPECARLRDAVARGPTRASTVYDGGTGEVRADAERRSREVDVEAWARSLVVDRLGSLLPRLAEEMGEPVTRFEDPVFLRYGPGDRFLAHVDRAEDRPGADPVRRSRRVSIVVFLNEASGDGVPGTYDGGRLLLCVFRDPRAERVGLEVDGESGLLLAFPSDLPHEVRPVARGERQTIVTWLAA